MAEFNKKEQWGTKLGVILAVSGSAVGLGNFLRFPGQAAQNGGGAFMIPYFCALLLLGIPIGWAEWSMARYGGRKGLHSGPAVLGVVGKNSLARHLGLLAVLIPLAVSFYYTYIEAWCLGYAWEYATGGIGVDAAAPVALQTEVAKDHFAQFAGTKENGAVWSGASSTVICWVLVFLINIWLIYRGISKGIEKFCSWAMPAMAVCAFIVLIRVLTLGTPDPAHPEQSVSHGLGYMWNPNWDKLKDPQTWLAAAGQIFFSLSVGFGVILNYASYLKRKDDVVLSGLTASATNEVFEVGFGGMITLTASVVFLGLAGTMEAVKTGSFGLGFTTLPVVFGHMGGFGTVIGAIWFFMLFLAAITSSISMYQPAVAYFEESLRWSKAKATGLCVGICLVGSFLVMNFSKGMEFLGAIDDWVGTLLIFVLAAVQIIYFSWVHGLERGWREMHEGSHIRIPGIYKFIMKWVTPLYLIVVFGFFCKENLPKWIDGVKESPMQQGALALVGATLMVLMLCLWRGEKNWRAEGLDIDDRTPASAD